MFISRKIQTGHARRRAIFTAKTPSANHSGEFPSRSRTASTLPVSLRLAARRSIVMISVSPRPTAPLPHDSVAPAPSLLVRRISTSLRMASRERTATSATAFNRSTLRTSPAVPPGEQLPACRKARPSPPSDPIQAALSAYLPRSAVSLAIAAPSRSARPIYGAAATILPLPSTLSVGSIATSLMAQCSATLSSICLKQLPPYLKVCALHRRPSPSFTTARLTFLPHSISGNLASSRTALHSPASTPTSGQTPRRSTRTSRPVKLLLSIAATSITSNPSSPSALHGASPLPQLS